MVCTGHHFGTLRGLGNSRSRGGPGIRMVHCCFFLGLDESFPDALHITEHDRTACRDLPVELFGLDLDFPQGVALLSIISQTCSYLFSSV